MKKMTLVTMTVLTLTSVTAHADIWQKIGKVGKAVIRGMAQPYQQDSRIVIRLGGQVFRGQQTVALKRLAKSQNPGLNFRNATLRRVKVVASSARGRGQISLTVGQNTSYPQIAQQDFGGQVNKMVFMNPSYSSQGKWQLQTRGNIQIKKIVLIVSGVNGGYQPPISYQEQCSVNLLTRRGRLLNSFIGHGVGMTLGHAKQNACSQAMQQCNQDLRMRHRSGRNPMASCQQGRSGRGGNF